MAAGFLRREWKAISLILGAFLLLYFLPSEQPRFSAALVEAFELARWYAREHVILCLVPAFFIAGAISVFLNQDSVMRYLGPRAPKPVAYGVASVSGTILAVCSCTVLPLFAGIYRMGAGLGPASAFLYSGPAINILAIVLTARILGPGLGLARVIGAVIFAVLIGLLMHLIFRREEGERADTAGFDESGENGRPLSHSALYLAAMVAVLVFANWGCPDVNSGFWFAVYEIKWILTSLSALSLGLILAAWFSFGWGNLLVVALPTAALALAPGAGPVAAFAGGTLLLVWRLHRRGGDLHHWFESSWGFAKQILPLLLGGVLIAGLFLGRPGQEGLLPSTWISDAVGGNSLGANFFASLAGALMYFATLTEVPILQGLIGAGMGKGPALALLLAGPALSLPNMLVIGSVLGARKTGAFVTLVVLMATISGFIYGLL